MDRDKEYEISQYNVFSKRNDSYIVIFPAIPFWIAITDEGIKALELLKQGNTVIDIASKVFGKTDTETIELLLQFFKPLEESQVIYARGNKPHVENIKLPDKPNKITFLQTMCCNLRCKHCCVADMPSNRFESMRIEDAKLILLRSKDIMFEGKKSVSFLGGEPLCGENFNELLDYAHEIGFSEIGISTNGILVDDAFAKTARRNGVNVQISLDGANKEMHESIRGKGTWEKTIQAIDILNKYGVDIQTNMVYHSGNIDCIEEYFDFAISKNIKRIRLISLMKMGRAKNELEMISQDVYIQKMCKLLKKRPDLIPYIDDTSFMGMILRGKISQKVISCGAGVITATIAPNGDVFPCLNLYSEEFKMCNLFETNYLEQFKNSKVKERFHNIHIDKMNLNCAKCELRYFCGGMCRGETYQILGNIEDTYPHCKSFRKAFEEILWYLVYNPEIGEEKYQAVMNGTAEYLDFWH